MTADPATGDQARLCVPPEPKQPAAAPLSPAKILEIATSGISSKGAAELLGTTQHWVTRLHRRGDLPALETPWGCLYSREDVLRVAEARRISGRAKRGPKPKRRPDLDGEVISTTAALPVQKAV